MKKKIQYALVFFLVLSVVSWTSCKRNAVQEPSPLGPSGYAYILKLSANPNVIFAGSSRESTTVSAKLSKYDGTPLSGMTILFQVVDAFGTQVNVGYFENNVSVASKTTDSSGSATVTYYGPLAHELTTDMTIYVYAYVAWQGHELIAELAPVHVIRDVTELTFELMADPNVLWCSSERPESEIKGIFRKADGTPIVGRKVFFEILSGKGEFSDGKTKTFAVTDSSGIATVTYVGPKNTEMDNNEEWVDIQGQAETYWEDADADKYYLHKELRIRLKKGS